MERSEIQGRLRRSGGIPDCAPLHPGYACYYEETGSGLPIVFVHEFAGDCRSYEPQVRYFARRYRCIVYNARGCDFALRAPTSKS